MGKTKGNVNKLSLVVQAYNSSMQGGAEAERSWVQAEPGSISRPHIALTYWQVSMNFQKTRKVSNKQPQMVWYMYNYSPHNREEKHLWSLMGFITKANENYKSTPLRIPRNTKHKKPEENDNVRINS